MEQKLPAYFEKYLNEKFSSLGDRFDEKFEGLEESMKSLKCHVNDEIQIIRVALEKLQSSVIRLYWVVAVLFILMIIGSYADINILDLFIKIFLK